MNTDAYRVERVRRALVHFVGGRVVQAAARALLVLALVRILPVADYGAYMLIIGTAELLLQFGSFGILAIAQRFLPQFIRALPLRTLYRFIVFLVLSQLVILGLLSGVLWWFWEVIAPFFNLSEQQVAATGVATLLFLVVPAFRFSAELLEAMLEQGRAQFVRALMVLSRAAVLGLLIMATPRVELTTVLYIDMVVFSLAMLLAWYLIRQSVLELHATTATGTIPVRDLVRFGLRMAVVSVLGAFGTTGAVRLVLANSMGIVEAGLFSFLQSLQSLVSRYLPATLLRGLIRPVLISRTVGTESTRVLEAGTGLLLKSNLLIVVGGMVVISICGDELVALLSGGKFTGAGATLLLIYLSMAAESQRSVQEMVMQITGHTNALAYTAAFAPLSLGVVWLLADHGLNVAVLIIAAGGLLANGMASTVLRWSTDWFRVDWRGMGVILLPALVAAALGIALSLMKYPLLAGGLGLAIYVLFVRIARPFRLSEISLVERVVGARLVRLVRGFAV